MQNADRLSLQNVICWLLKVISSSAACFGLEDSTVVFHFEGHPLLLET